MFTAHNFHPTSSPHPLHVGIIPDGGRRWALNNGCSLAVAYQYTCQKLESLVETLWPCNVNELSIYIASKENFRRPDNEVNAFIETTKKAFELQIAGLALKHNLRVCVAGNKAGWPASLAEAARHVENQTAANSKGTLNLCVGYHPADEILYALQRASCPEDFYNFLWVKKPVDLIIRSGGANVLSNFLPLQTGYARLYFFSELFNDLNLDQILQTIELYRKEVLKYGT